MAKKCDNVMAAKYHLPAEQVRRIRRLLGETQAQFAKRFDVEPVTVARWETGQRKCAGIYAKKIAELDPNGSTLFSLLPKEEVKMETHYQVIAFFNHKGGVSKTTTTYNLGWALANQGKRVLMIDGDPQCNLTGMTMALSGEEDFEDFYKRNKKSNLYEALSPALEALPEPLSYVECFEVQQRPGLYLLPGHVALAEYDVRIGVAHELSGSLGVTKNIPGAISALIKKCAVELNIDYVLIDMGPSISAINQSFFMTSTHFIVPASPDYFCSLAIDSLAKVLPRWAEWPKKAKQSGVFENAAYPIPIHTPLFIGVINQRFRPRYGVPAQAFQLWIERINEKVKNKLVPILQKNQMMLPEDQYQVASVNGEPYSLANIPDFNSLIARSQDYNVPVFELTDQQLETQGFVLETMRNSKNQFADLFDKLAKRMIEITLLQTIIT
jgi:cellulose biosynthesis protein BcsQ/DNA-binding transcriptional regulator YiaG